MFGIHVPKIVKEAYEFDKENGNTAEAIQVKMSQLDEYHTFEDKGPHTDEVDILKDYQWIRCQCMFEVKHDLQRKCHFVAGGHMTQNNKESVYLSIVSLRGIRLAIFWQS
jgi:hypothetical protein